MCTYYTDLNKTRPKDSYSSIDRLVDGAAGHKVLSFLDAYSGYNQIPMNLANREKTTFLDERANFCYEVMPFGLKNVEETYQRLMYRMFWEQIGKNVEVYVNDMIVKSDSAEQHATDLTEIFGQVRWYGMRLNLEKCVYDVEGGKIFGLHAD